jgi:hypothetical protein
MLEIILIWKLTHYIGRVAALKGYKKLGYQWMAVLLWLSGELSGFLIGSIFFGSSGNIWLSYITALLGAIVGASIAFFVTNRLPPYKVNLSPVTSSYTVQKANRSLKWIPAVVSLLAVSCLCISFVAVLGYEFISTLQVTAKSLKVGTEIGADGYLLREDAILPARSNAIYLDFYIEGVSGITVPLSFDLFVDGGPAYSFSESHQPGHVITKLDRREWGLSKFATGDFMVEIKMGDDVLTTATFEIIE